ncbi:MAG: DUF5009 domain-containing protein [Chitinophagaceae bacterium]
MNIRNESLDALRGFAILAMVLSGSIAFGDTMPAWMYHAQVPPPIHEFNPALPGITWVDLVFPFFLFSMGAAIPLSLQKHVLAKSSIVVVTGIAFKRFALLAFFALFTEHMKAWVMSSAPVFSDHLLSILAFVLLFFQFYETRKLAGSKVFIVVKAFAFLAAIVLLWKLPFHDGAGFSFYKSDIIIIVLANMAFFGTIIYWVTREKPLLRLGLLPFIMAIFLAAKEPADGWAKAFFNFNHIGSFQIDWLYQFYFLKYLFIVLPATCAGEWILKSMQANKTLQEPEAKKSKEKVLAAILSLLIVGCNLAGLFTRMLLVNFIVTMFLCLLMYWLAKKQQEKLLRQFSEAGIYLLSLGLCFEAYEGGIKKDHSTYSYYFVTTGLAFFMLISFSVLARLKYVSRPVRYLALNGKNPMVAYVAGALLLLPLLSLTYTQSYWDSLHQNAWMGLLKGVLFTGVVSLVTVFFVRKKWFWKT